MRWLCLLLTFAAACAPSTRELALHAPIRAAEPARAEPSAETRVTSLPRRSARLSPPFAGSASTRRIDAVATPLAATPVPAMLELAAAR